MEHPSRAKGPALIEPLRKGRFGSCPFFRRGGGAPECRGRTVACSDCVILLSKQLNMASFRFTATLITIRFR